LKSKTKEKVLKVIEANNDAPSAVAKSLSEQNTHNIGVIFPDIENPFFTMALKGISEVAEKNQYNVRLYNIIVTRRCMEIR
jgi:LacI family transcriptional regulator